MKKSVVVVGGLNIDIKAKAYGIPVAKSSNPGTVETTPGGVGRNIAHNLALLGVPVTFLSVIGKNDEGSGILEQTAAAGVNVEHVLKLEGLRTGTYIALLDNRGEMELAVSDMQVLEHLTVEYLESKAAIIAASDYIVCDANIPASSVRYLVSLAGSLGIPICVEPVSVSKALKIKDMLSGIDIITPNRDELEVLINTDSDLLTLEQNARQLLSKGISNVLVTLGKEGICLIDSSGARSYPSFPTKVLDVTGAGDSLTAGLLYGLLKSGNMEDACIAGLAAAAITVASKDTVSEELSEETLRKVIEQGYY